MQNIYIYSDESGVFDKKHNNFFIYSGIILLSKEEKENCKILFLNLEKRLKIKYKIGRNKELKATMLNKKEKMNFLRSLNKFHKFTVIIDLNKVISEIFLTKKSKQRHLDYSYKLGIKKAFEYLIKTKIVNNTKETILNINYDEHTISTDAYRTFKEDINDEFKNGRFNYKYNKFHPPIFKKLENLHIKSCNSSNTPLIRVSDILSNIVYTSVRDNVKNKEIILSKFIKTYTP
ncbi:DUF3800 domain-containing protein [Streptobacillus moniliformis]|uniref:DUF3800 domain-containing protein n=1 Tax=Streptobacillus moniliformis TaxID=34105 RepID=UPI0007E481E7|nr:DUF3800 domain-containing protein [Streptobacillus moniliformis]QXW65620.1 DUF3800 domain-containing protein [Streptobacillus moniliformis]